MPLEPAAMLGAQVWVVRWSPREGVTAADVETVLTPPGVDARAGGRRARHRSLTSGPGVAGRGPHGAAGVHRTGGGRARRPGPVRRQGAPDLRGPRVAVMEGALTVRVSFGTTTYRIS